MKISKIILAAALLFSFVIAGNAQSAKLVEKAAAATEKLNTKITSVNPELALTDEQREKIQALQIEKMKETRKIKKSELTEEEMKVQKKETNKKYGKQINAVLTKEQRMAKKEARNAKKE